MAQVAGVLLDHVHEDPTEAHCSFVLPRVDGEGVQTGVVGEGFVDDGAHALARLAPEAQFAGRDEADLTRPDDLLRHNFPYLERWLDEANDHA